MRLVQSQDIAMPRAKVGGPSSVISHCFLRRVLKLVFSSGEDAADKMSSMWMANIMVPVEEVQR